MKEQMKMPNPKAMKKMMEMEKAEHRTRKKKGKPHVEARK